MTALLLLVPAGPLLSWKRGDAKGVLQRLWVALGLAAVTAGAVFVLVSPRHAWGAAGVGLAVWLIVGALVEFGERTVRRSGAETWRRVSGLPRGAWGMTLAHMGLGLFVLGACFETTWKAEAAEVLTLGQGMDVGAYHLVLDKVGDADGPNYDAERGVLTATRGGAPACVAEPERRFYPAGGQTTSEVSICTKGLSHLYVVLGERRAVGETPAWLVRAYWNPLALLIFLGPVVMALGGLISLSDRRLRLGAPRRREQGRSEQAA
jgi:cytochrome c-type biogenesis protein CcmF